jgi:hypothetical protein
VGVPGPDPVAPLPPLLSFVFRAFWFTPTVTSTEF